MALFVLVLQAACATGYPRGGQMMRRAGEVSTGQASGAPGLSWHQARRAGDVDEAENLRGSGWPDGVGDGQPYEAPITLDYFQGFLVQAGVPTSAVPGDGRTLSPQQAMELLPHLLFTPVTLGNFGLRRMAAHLLLEVATGGLPVSRDELHARMRRFSRLLVLRPDGYLVKPTTGDAVQKAGAVGLAEDGTLHAGRFEVGPFYAIDGARLFPVDHELTVPHGARPAGIYSPDKDAGLAVGEGAVLAVVDMVEGLYRLVFYTGETLEGLAQLPGAVRQLYENSPQLWEEFRHKPYAERVRTVSRLAMGSVLTVGTAGAGTAKAVAWGGKLGSLSVPLLSLSGDGLLAVRLVAVPVGSLASTAAPALSATYVLHMASTSAQGGGGGGGWPPVGGPGQWVEDTSSMSEQARAYQAQVTGAPKRWAYKVCRDGECVNYDGYDPKTGTLLEAKAREYAKWFDEKLDPRFNYEGLDDMVAQAERQLRVAGGGPLRWHVAEPRMVAVLRKWFDLNDLRAVEVVYTQPIP
ncbi:MAG TPA: restriction endonuclease fold toxin 5 domain-containing protein [Archangium sp.]|uniref:restriction endonuclease fold toxin 5 domain-containing protein n=1 Tax=Archangium sp. TaxID=1872627 RepID=UPI002EDA4AF8